MTELPKATVKRIGVSNFYASHLTKLFDVCQELNLQKPFANEIQINPYVYCLEKDTLDLCFQNSIQKRCSGHLRLPVIGYYDGEGRRFIGRSICKSKLAIPAEAILDAQRAVNMFRGYEEESRFLAQALDIL